MIERPRRKTFSAFLLRGMDGWGDLPMRATRLLIGWPAGLAATISPVLACQGSKVPYLASYLPEVREGEFAAEVEIVEVRPDGLQRVIEARVLRILAGDYKGRLIRLESRSIMLSSCDREPIVGENGFVVGTVTGSYENGIVVDPDHNPRTKSAASAPPA